MTWGSPPGGAGIETCAVLGAAVRHVAASLRTEVHALSEVLAELERVGHRLEARGTEPYDPGVLYEDSLIQTGRSGEQDLRSLADELREMHDLLDRFG